MSTDGRSDQALHERISTARVVRFFLRLYALQLRAPDGAPSRYTLVDSQFAGLDSIYSLSVKIGNRFESRRLTIGKIGTQNSSKSFCYKVVFDEPVVVKIPARPIKTFRAYLKSLRSQRLIVDQYKAGNRIIAPGVTAFFKATQVNDGFFAGSTGRFESWGARWLETHPEYHPYLKIGDSFVFLMDLSSYTFLSDAIYRIHDVTADIPDEILRYPNVLWDFHGFENRYGRAHARVYFQMNSIWAEYERKLRHLANQFKTRPRTVYEQRQWLLARLAGETPKYSRDLQLPFVAAIERMATRLLGRHHQAVADYRKTVKAYIKRISFSKNKLKIKGLIVSLLDLQAWLGQHRLAIRDLKPDNLFIAGHTEKHTYLTADPAKYYLGLIDIETACGLESESDYPVQPLLGGTPSYATLSQFYPNSILSRVYPDLSLSFHLQDWYAIVVMIYEVLTGYQLFEKTRKILFDIKSWSKRLQTEAVSPVEAFRSGNYIFFHRATEEFNRNIRANKRRLKAILIEPTDETREMIIRYADQQLAKTSEAIARIVAEHADLLEEAYQRQLFSGSWEQITALRRQLEKSTRMATQLPEKEAYLLNSVKQLEGHSLILESLLKGVEALEQPQGAISVYRLLRLLFYTVTSAMGTSRLSWEPSAKGTQDLDGHGVMGPDVLPSPMT